MTLALVTIISPFLVLLLISLYSQYRDAVLLQKDGHTVLVAATNHDIAITALMAIVWLAAVLLLTLRAVEARVLGPLDHLTGVASRLAEGALDSRVDLTLIRMVDMRRLGATVNVMADILEKLALTDSLTAIANRRQFDTVIAEEVKRSTRLGKGLALLLIDVDKFKDYNDLYGHGAGDLCLKRIAAVLRTTVSRPSDLVARYGGEEFVVLLPDTDATGAHAVASELLSAVRAMEMTHAGWERGIVTISIGGAVSSPQAAIDAAQLAEQADQALYAAKEAGRDRALMYETVVYAA